MNYEIKVEIEPWLSKALGKKSKVTLTETIRQGASLQSVFETIARKHDGFAAMIYDIKHRTVYETVVVFVNNRPTTKDLNTKMQPGDKIVITPLYSGG